MKHILESSIIVQIGKTVFITEFLTIANTLGSLLELLYGNNLVLCGESVKEVMQKYEKWKKALEGKGLYINMGKTKRHVRVFSIN